jgi:type IV secretory pathway TrbF-like protein
MVKSDGIHFIAAKKNQQLRIKTQIGHFICNIRSVGEEVDNLLKQMRFIQIYTWEYDPFGVISELRVQQISNPYAHTHNMEVDIYMNQTEWKENTLLETKEKTSLITASHTNTPQKK